MLSTATARRFVFALAATTLLLAPPAWGKKKPPEFGAIEVTRFSKQHGVELTQAFLDYLYDALLRSPGMHEVFAKAILENEVVPPSDAPQTLTLRGVILEYGKGSFAKSLIGFGVGRRSLEAQITLSRRMDDATVFETHIKVRSKQQLSEKVLAVYLAKELGNKIKDNTKQIRASVLEADRRYVPPPTVAAKPVRPDPPAPDPPPSAPGEQSRDAAARPAQSTAPRPSADKDPETPAPEPAQEPGVVLVSSNLEGAEVYVDDSFVGNAPALIKLIPGKYTFRVIMAGQADWVRELSVLPGSELKILARHTPKATLPKPSAPAPDPAALSKKEILDLLTNFVPSARITALVKEHGVKFTPTAADLNEVADAGGDQHLLETLRKAPAPADR